MSLARLSLPLLVLMICSKTTAAQSSLPTDRACPVAPQLHTKGVGYTPGSQTWEGGIVPYYFDLPNDAEGRLLEETMKQSIKKMNAETNVCWIPTMDNDSGVRIFKSEEFYNYASLGYYEGSQHSLAMISPSVGVGLHEMCHVLGMLHEHQRPDRDKYVTVHENNISADFRHAFAKVEFGLPHRYLLATPYDFSSIMHYHAYALSRNDQPTITNKQGGTQGFGTMEKLSKFDIQQINAMYPNTISRQTCDSLVRSRYFDVSFSVQGAGLKGINCPNRETILTALPVGSDQRGLRYTWAVEAGLPASGSGKEFSVFFKEPGNYPVTLRVYREDRLIIVHHGEARIYPATDELRILGNPVASPDFIHCQLTTNQQDYSLQLINTAGQRVYNKDYTAANCTVEEFIPTDRLAPGVYWLVYVRGKETFSKKVVVI